jgi:hypothetical protein
MSIDEVMALVEAMQNKRIRRVNLAGVEIEMDPSAFTAVTPIDDLVPKTRAVGADAGEFTEEQILFFSSGGPVDIKTEEPK